MSTRICAYDGATENAGVENVAPDSSGGKHGNKWQSCNTIVSGNVSSYEYTNLNIGLHECGMFVDKNMGKPRNTADALHVF